MKKEKTYTDGLLNGYNRGFEQGKKEALIELQKENTNTELPSNETLYKIFRLLFEHHEILRKTSTVYMNQYESDADYITQNWHKYDDEERNREGD